MKNDEKYNILSEGETGTPSTMGIIPASKNFKFTEELIKHSLAKNSSFELISFSQKEENTYSSEIKYKDEIFLVILYVVPTSQINLDNYNLGNQIEKSDFDTAQQQSHFL